MSRKTYIASATNTSGTLIHDWKDILHAIGFEDFNTSNGTEMIGVLKDPEVSIIVGSMQMGWITISGVPQSLKSEIQNEYTNRQDEDFFYYLNNLIDSGRYPNLDYGTIDSVEDLMTYITV